MQRRAGWPGFVSRQRQEISLCSTAPRASVGFLLNVCLGLLLLGKSRRGANLTTRLRLVSTRFHDVAVNKLNTGISLRLLLWRSSVRSWFEQICLIIIIIIITLEPSAGGAVYNSAKFQPRQKPCSNKQRIISAKCLPHIIVAMLSMKMIVKLFQLWAINPGYRPDPDMLPRCTGGQQ